MSRPSAVNVAQERSRVVAMSDTELLRDYRTMAEVVQEISDRGQEAPYTLVDMLQIAQDEILCRMSPAY